MKTIIWKELRENFKLAVIGLAIFTFMLVECYRHYSEFFTELSFGQTNWQFNDSHPLLSDRVLAETAFFCAIFGAVLGWLQIHNERHRDLWAYLVHRPISRSEIFFGKVIAGACLYAAGAALPLLGYIIIAWMPGHFPVPFTLPMVLPFTSLFLIGIVFYFAGLLTGIRQARWYVSRALGLGMGILLAAFSMHAPDFWRVLIFLVPAVLIAGTAAWGSFVSGGYYEGQPTAGRRSLVVSLMLGCFVVTSVAASLVWSLFSPPDTDSWSYYQMSKDGTVYKSTRTPGKPVVIADLNGQTLMDKTTGRPMLQNDFNKILAGQSTLYVDFEPNSPERYYLDEGFNSSANYFSLWRQTVDTLWYWRPNGRLSGYDLMSRRRIGSIGPDGFTRGVATGPKQFTRMEGPYGNGYYSEWYPGRTLLTDTAVYQLDYDHRTSKLFFATTNNEPIGGAVDVSVSAGSWDYTIVATKDAVRVLKPDGTFVAQAPYEPKYPSYPGISVYFLEPTNTFAFWFNPNYQTNALLNWKLPSHVVWVAADQTITKTLDVPSVERNWHEPFMDKVINNVFMPPAFHWFALLTYSRDFSNVLFIWKGQAFWISLAGAVITTGVGWGLGRRYYFNAQAQLKWAIFNLCFGLPGLLAFICALEWPAREACPNCKKLRMVDREHCEHCGADFPPPPRNGTEIFEPVEAK